MSVISRTVTALNQSFKLTFVSVGKGINFLFLLMKKTITLLAKAVNNFRRYLAMAIQIFINISVALLFLFIPVILLLDPLKWSRHLEAYLSEQNLFWVRMCLGAFFLVAAYFLVNELYSAWKNSSDEEEGNKQKKDFIGWVSNMLAWLVIILLMFYFTIFRLHLIPSEWYFSYLPFWAQEMLMKLYPN